ncbi:MAG: DMT family transporter [Rhodovibrionaceae bacterium]
MTLKEWSLLLLLALLWSGSFFLAEIALRELDFFSVVLGRVGPAAIALLLLVALTGQQLPRDWASWGAFMIMGLLNNAIPFGLIFWGQQSIDSGLAAILNATTPFFAVILAHLLTTDERLTPNRIGGILSGIAGVAVLVGPDALRSLGAETLGQFAVLGAAFSYACAGIFGRRLRSFPVSVAATGMVTCSALIALPVALVFGAPFAALPSTPVWAAILGLSLLSTAAAYLVYFRILATAGATNLMLVTLLLPAGALVLGMVFLNERFSWSAFAGLALILLGLLAVDGRAFRVLARRPAVQPGQ